MKKYTKKLCSFFDTLPYDNQDTKGIKMIEVFFSLNNEGNYIAEIHINYIIFTYTLISPHILLHKKLSK